MPHAPLSSPAAQEKFNTLVLPHRGLLLAKARQLAGADRAEAEDLVQETLLRAYVHVGNVVNEKTITGWLCAILRNLHINHYHRQHREGCPVAPQWLEETLPSSAHSRRANPEYQVMVRHEYRAVLAAIETLPAEYRAPLVLADIEEWSYQDIADQLKLPIGTVRSRIFRGRRRIRHDIESPPAAL